MKIRTCKIYTLGCKVNQCDSAALGSLFADKGWPAARSDADLAVINTCAVTRTAARKSRQAVNKARRENPRAKIGIIGCWPRIYWPEAQACGADFVFIDKNYAVLKNKIFKKFTGKTGVKKSDNTLADGGKNNETIKPGYKKYNKSRYFLKIQDGCEQFCSYCVIPFTRGKLADKPFKKVIREAESAIKAGYAEIVLCGIHLGRYGQGRRSKKLNLNILLKKLLVLSGLGRIRLSSIEAGEINDGLIALAKNNKKLCPHFHLPLQSGSDRILALMNRPYRASDFTAKVAAIRKKLPLAAISTDIIVGFPGENEDDFKKTFYLAKKLKFSRIHIFPFSLSEKTAAYRLPDRVSSDRISARAAELRRLGERLAKNFRVKLRNKLFDVLIEKKIGNIFRGKSEYYFDVDIKEAKLKKKIQIGEIIKFKK